MPQDHVTLILIDDENGKTRDFNFSRRGLTFLSIFLFISLIYGINLFIDYRKMNVEIIDLIPSAKNLSVKNDQMELEKKDLGNKIHLLNKQISELREYDILLKEKFTLDNNIIGEEMGMGGSEEDIEEDDLILKFSNALDEFDEDNLRTPLDIENDISIQKESFKELIKFLNTQDARLKATPAIWPLRGFQTSGFGFRLSPFSGRPSFHKGLDIAARKGAPVKVTADGIVVFSGWQEGYGKLVVVDHGYGYRTFYGHNSSLLVEKGKHVKRRDIITLVGSTGHSTGPHLHYEVYVNGNVENPQNFILEGIGF